MIITAAVAARSSRYSVDRRALTEPVLRGTRRSAQSAAVPARRARVVECTSRVCALRYYYVHKRK